MSSDCNATREKALREIITYLSREEWSKAIPEIGTNVHRIVKRITGNADPYEQLKTKYNGLASELYPKLKLLVKSSSDPLLTAVKIAIAGNAIDFGPKTEINLEQEIQNALNCELAVNDLDRFKSALRSRSVLYLADNAGETFFDRILIEEIVKHQVEVTYVVKGGPILNDATLEDAKTAGIDRVANVMSTGTDCTGILFDECSREFLNAFKKSNVVISKGQGNYESLNEVRNKEVFFLLKIKCPIIAEKIGVETGSMVLKRV